MPHDPDVERAVYKPQEHGAPEDGEPDDGEEAVITDIEQRTTDEPPPDGQP